MSTHTPGPWAIDSGSKEWRDDNGLFFFDEIVCVADGNRRAGHALAYVWHQSFGDVPHPFQDENEANARLIAAAPELLAAVRSLTVLREDEAGVLVGPQGWSILQTVVAMATGQGATR